MLWKRGCLRADLFRLPLCVCVFTEPFLSKCVFDGNVEGSSRSAQWEEADETCIWPSEALCFPVTLPRSPLLCLDFISIFVSSCFFYQCAVPIFSHACLLVCLFSLVSFIFHLIFFFFQTVSLLPTSPVISCLLSLFCFSASPPSSFITLTLSDNSTCVRLPLAPPHRI